MIDHDRKIIFVANCKTGTTSIVEALGLPGIKMHWPARRLRSDPNIKPYWNQYFKFGFVRNPWDLLVSWWHYMSPHHKQESFDKFIKNIHANIPLKKWLWTCNWDTVSDANDDLIVDFVGRFERINEDLATVCDLIGEKRPKLRHTNKTRHKPYQSYYNVGTRNKVGRMCWKDLNFLGYRYDG